MDNKKIYITSQGDTWDVISLQVYKTETLMHILLSANPQYRNIAVFSANCKVEVPDVSQDEKVEFPPWKRDV